MSIECIRWAIEVCSIKGPDKAVLVAIANRAHDDGTGAYPSLETLAHDSGFDRRTVVNSLRRLKESGVLSVQSKAGPQGSNSYILHPDRERGSLGNVVPRERGSLGIGNVVPKGREPDSLKPSLNRPKPLSTTKGQVEPPEQLREFDRILREIPAYQPTREFYEAVLENYADRPLKLEAVKMVGWWKAQSGKKQSTKGTTAFVLNWLGRQPRASPNGQAATTQYHKTARVI